MTASPTGSTHGTGGKDIGETWQTAPWIAATSSSTAEAGSSAPPLRPRSGARTQRHPHFAVVKALNESPSPPEVFVSTAGKCFYGARELQTNEAYPELDEDSKPMGLDFPAELVAAGRLRVPLSERTPALEDLVYVTI